MKKLIKSTYLALCMVLPAFAFAEEDTTKMDPKNVTLKIKAEDNTYNLNSVSWRGIDFAKYCSLELPQKPPYKYSCTFKLPEPENITDKTQLVFSFSKAGGHPEKNESYCTVIYKAKDGKAHFEDSCNPGHSPDVKYSNSDQGNTIDVEFINVEFMGPK